MRETTETLVAELVDIAEVMESLGDLRKARVIRAAAERMKELQHDVPKWISVEERLPERNGRYLTHCKIEDQSLVCILYYCKVGGFNEGTVTHWMPVPEPPGETGGA